MTAVLAASVLASALALGAEQVSTMTMPPQAPARDTSAQVKGTASIKGKVVTADGGRAIRRVQISVTSRELAESRSVSTNSQGVFEITELPAGRYTLTASRGGYLRLQYGQRHPGESGRPIQLADGQKVTNADFALPRASTIVGRITDEIGDPLAGASIFPVQWKFFRGQRRLVPVGGGGAFNRTDDTGGYRITGLEPGEYFVMATTRDSWTDEQNPKEKIGFLPTYSGGTANPSSAHRIKVGLGQEVLMPDFAMVPGRVGTISGTAMSSSGRPLAGESVSMMQEFAGPGMMSSFGAPGTKIGPDGTFTIRNVSPGEYKISVAVPAQGDRAAEGAATTVIFSGDDLGGVMLVTTAGGTISGRIVSDTGEALPVEQKMRVSARPVDPTRTYSRYDAENGRVGEDLTFELKGVIGASRVSISPIPQGWALRSIQFEGRDLVDSPIDLEGRKIDGVTIVLSKTLPHLRGALTDGRGQPAEGTVLLFPADPERWAEESRLIRPARPDDAGTFEFADVLPGDYLVAALAYVRTGDWADPAYLEALREKATPVRVEEGVAPAPVALVLGDR
jgi:hypothetical protein